MPTELRIEGMDGMVAWQKRLTVSYEEAFKEELRAFYHGVTGGHTPVTSAPDSRADLDVLAQIARAARSA